jgi:plastocyanin
MDQGVTRRQFAKAAGGAVAVGATATPAAAQEGEGEGEGESESGGTPDFGGYIDGAKGGEFEDLRGESEVTVEVGVGSDGLAFAPTGLWIDPGTTVLFEWVSSGHNVLPEDQPDGSGWEGIEAIEGEGFEDEFTFETGGIYTYFCSPHKQLGMLGAIAVGDDVPMVSSGGGGGPTGPVITDGAKTLIVATMAAFATTLSLAYVFLKYGGNPPDPGSGTGN